MRVYHLVQKNIPFLYKHSDEWASVLKSYSQAM